MAPHQMEAPDLEALRDRIEDLSPSLRLILAAGLIDSGALALAKIVIDQVSRELTLLQVERKL